VLKEGAQSVAKTEMYRTKDGRKRFQIAAPVAEETYEALRRIAYDERTSLAAQVRQAAEEFVAHRRRPSRRVR
jgi:hypothetical protein